MSGMRVGARRDSAVVRESRHYIALKAAGNAAASTAVIERISHKHGDELVFRIDPEMRSVCTAPTEAAVRENSIMQRYANAAAEHFIGWAFRIGGNADGRTHSQNGAAGEHGGVANCAYPQHLCKAQIIVGGRDKPRAAAMIAERMACKYIFGLLRDRSAVFAVVHGDEAGAHGIGQLERCVVHPEREKDIITHEIFKFPSACALDRCGEQVECRSGAVRAPTAGVECKARLFRAEAQRRIA